MSDEILPNEVVRTAASPERMITDFINSTYTPAATLGDGIVPASKVARPSKRVAAVRETLERRPIQRDDM